ncbi:MAG: 16S rRNA (cytosine(1402)-N(4))-methyltransferase RsmH [Lentisphaeria bacterium]|nr:16S rRNA (cytosine(1402)-N(4))-methyltransferase RsmH [Lentisphaeria bacterium]
MSTFHHIPVLAEGVLEHLTFPVGRKVRMIDGTLGGGGHSSMLLEKYPQLELLGIDRDEMALESAAKKLAFAGSRVHLCHGEYAGMKEHALSIGWESVDGILLDIGVSSPQIDLPERGFSWRNNGPLDMRMDQSSDVTAGRVLNFSSEEELCRIFREYGELRSAAKLARAVVERRKEGFFGTTADLVRLCDDTLGKSAPGKLPVPTLVFQALRIAVNGELEQLEEGLAGALELLAPGGRLAVISFHSLEDRIVKEFFRRESASCICPPGLPVCCCGHKALLNLPLRSKVVTASKEELKNNPRAACAKLRIAEKI